MDFQKYSGAGNKFIIFNNLNEDIADKSGTVLSLFEGGSNTEIDGVIFIERSKLGDFWMNYYNRDGTADSLCGNGLRCTVRYLLDNGITGKDDLLIESVGKTYKCKLQDDGQIKVSFPPPEVIRAELKLKVNFSGWWEDLNCSYVNVGTPHIVIFLENINIKPVSLEDVNVNEWGRNVRMHKDLMPEGANVNFINVIDADKSEIAMRTYERGVERETLACGTGALSSGIVSFILKNIKPPVKILTRSGENLTVDFNSKENDFTDLTLTGGAQRYD